MHFKPVTLIYLLFPYTIAQNLILTQIFEWTGINFTWRSVEAYEEAIRLGTYIPENNGISGLKFYKYDLYLSLPRYRKGAPATLAVLPNYQRQQQFNPLLRPYPSWKLNSLRCCGTLQSVLSMEIDTKGVMWVIDGVRTNNISKCPPKLVLLDLENKGNILHSYVFPNTVCLTDGGYLNDLVVDESNGGYAYISDSSPIDPGLIVYSRQQNRAWKLRDRSMFGDPRAVNFTVDGYTVTDVSNINGIALSSVMQEVRKVYYSPLPAYNLYAINVSILQNETLSRTNKWRTMVEIVGQRSSQGDGMMIDSKGNLYFGLVRTSGIGVWNSSLPFSESDTFYNPDIFVWPNSFAVDREENLNVVTGGINKYSNLALSVAGTIFRIFRSYIGYKNYMYDD